MIIETFPSGHFETNAYVVACPHTRQAGIIDPAPGSFKKITSFIEHEQLKPVLLLLTHSHWDHIAEAHQIKQKYHIPVCIHALDAPNLETPGEDGLPCWISIEGVSRPRLIDEKSSIDIGDLHFKIIHTPGHTPGGVCYYCPKENVLFSGDTLFKGTIGNLSFPTAEPELMWPSLDKLAKLPLETRVYPGHGPSTTIGHEKWLPRAREIFNH